MGSYVKTPKWLKQTRAILNIKPTSKKAGDKAGDRCFLNVVYASLHRNDVKNPQRSSHYSKFYGTLNETKISSPIKKTEISKFELMNPQITVNLYAHHLQKGQAPLLYPYRISSNRGPDKHIVNMLILEAEIPDKDPHLVLITNLSALTGRNQSGAHRKTYTCPFCLTHIEMSKRRSDHAARIASHTDMCMNFNPMTISYPPLGSTLKFQEHFKCIEVPYYILYDYESMEKLVQRPENKKESPLPTHIPRTYPWIRYPSQQAHVMKQTDPLTGKLKCACNKLQPCLQIKDLTQIRARLEPISVAYLVVSTTPDQPSFGPIREFHGAHCQEEFLQSLKRDCAEIYERLHINIPVIMNEEEKRAFEMNEACQVCGGVYTEKNKKTLDHLHSDGSVRFFCCSNCNLKLVHRNISILGHNASGTWISCLFLLPLKNGHCKGVTDHF